MNHQGRLSWLVSPVMEKEGPARDPIPLASAVQGPKGESTELRHTRVYRFTWLHHVLKCTCSSFFITRSVLFVARFCNLNSQKRAVKAMAWFFCSTLALSQRRASQKASSTIDDVRHDRTTV